MPWTPGDADRHKAGLTHANKIRWARTANAVLAEELAKGTPNSEAEGKAIRIASSKIKAGTRTKGPAPLSRPVSRPRSQ